LRVKFAKADKIATADGINGQKKMKEVKDNRAIF